MALTRRAGLAALLAAVVVLLSPGGWRPLVAVEGALLVALIVDVALAGSVRRLTVSRSGLATVRQGEPVTVTITIANLGRRWARGLLRDAWPPSADAEPAQQRFDVPAGRRSAVGTVLRPARRGERAAAAVSIRSVGPLGLAGRQGQHAAPWTVRVLPAFSRRHLPERLARLRTLEGSARVTLRGQGSEFDSLREYVVGDDVRSIDWRASARAVDVMVRTWRPERDRRVVLVVDTARTAAARVGNVPRLDAAIDARLLLGALAARAGDRVDLLAIDRVPRARVEGPTRSQVLPRLVEALAPLEATLVEPDYRRMVAEVLRRNRRRCLVVLFTALDAAPLEPGLLPVLPSLTARHVVVVASVRDPRIDELTAARGDVGDVYACGRCWRRVWHDRNCVHRRCWGGGGPRACCRWSGSRSRFWPPSAPG